MQLQTLYSSNTPVACHIIKGRLESDGLDCFLFDEQVVWVHPFYAVAIGGVKLKVRAGQLKLGQNIMALLNDGKLCDENGTYNVSEALQQEFERQQEIMKLKSKLRKNPELLDRADSVEAKNIGREELNRLLQSEKEFQQWANKKLNFTWKDFFYELFGFDRSVFAYLRFRPVVYYLEKDLTDKFRQRSETSPEIICPNCGSDNVGNSYAIDHRWNVLYLVLSLIFWAPFPLMHKKAHCFDCGHNFKNKSSRNF